MRNFVSSGGWMAVVLFMLLFSGSAHAHAETGVADGFTSGFMHPLLGPDHLLAMVAVGLWGAQLGRPAIWVLPITFPLMMALGALWGILGVALPGIETGVAASALILGLMVAFAVRPILPIAMTLVAIFALFHGFAHGAELPDAANPLAYGIGFVTATGLLHLVGIMLGILVRWPMGAWAVRLSGSSIALFGLYFLGINSGVIS